HARGRPPPHPHAPGLQAVPGPGRCGPAHHRRRGGEVRRRRPHPARQHGGGGMERGPQAAGDHRGPAAAAPRPPPAPARGRPARDVRECVGLELEIEHLESQLAGYARDLADVSPGRGYVAAKLEGAERMQQLYGKLLETLAEDPDSAWLTEHVEEMGRLATEQ